MHTGFRRIIAWILVISLMMTMTGCGTIDGRPASFFEIILYALGRIVQVAVLVIGELVLLVVFMAVDLVMSSIEKVVGGGDWWVVEDVGGPVMRGYGRLIDPEGVFADWSEPEEDDSYTVYDESDRLYGDTELETEEFIFGEKEGKTELSGFEKFWDALFGCDHEEKRYDPDTLDIACKCGVYFVSYHEEMSLEEFRSYVKKKWLQSQNKYDEYTMQEYCRYVARHNDVDPEMLRFALELDVPDLDIQKMEKLSGIVGFLGDASDLISTSADVCDGLAKGLDISTEFFEKINTYFEAANIVFVAVKAGVDMTEYKRLAEEPGKEREMVHSAIDVLQGATSLIPVAGVAFDEALDVVETGLETLLKGKDIEKMQALLYDNLDYTGPLADVTRFWNIHNRQMWENQPDQCPSLKELSDANLSAEELYALAPYIEFRLQYEMEEIFGTDIRVILSE